MTKLIVQIPCYNEAEDLPVTLAAIPRRIEGVDIVEILVIDDGSHDGTSEVAKRWGVHHIVRHRRNRGLAAAFRTGIRTALDAGADIIVNTDADGQYVGEDIARIVEPIVAREADVVIGDRGVANNAYFGPFKRLLQRLGSTVVRRLSRTDITDAVSGFRAITRAAAQQINITTDFSYTTDMLIQSGRKRFAIKSVPIRTNETMRPSRLFTSIPRFITNTGITIARAYTTHNPLRVFVGSGALIALIGLAPIMRFVWFYATGDGDGHIQSLVIGGALLVLGALVATMGVLADLVASNRKLIETSLYEIRELRDQIKQQKASESVADGPKQDIREAG
ncbi:glycosyltransferase family 2 protein [Pontixanthobacter aestiaquae]|uniref:Glycosyltransferase n=1 Tax=Pontixanthobacter aestiaquae TaxID=1509367 RepID=A0A844Z8F2_9SPHN|nr:glycosyltransferase family 2 protein [Pontixanthobacter aestiaquae]MDN3645896.1 glycosyltransferase family 2 protein [Pontixanthobacter aestiaquae]MXO83110.1 glycosyltransferase [Pontixanthobacter aestiaquae]